MNEVIQYVILVFIVSELVAVLWRIETLERKILGKPTLERFSHPLTTTQPPSTPANTDENDTDDQST